MTPAALAIDLGTTAAKAAVVTLDGRILGSGLRPLTTLTACSDALGEAGSDAVLEGVALQMRWLADEAEHLLGIHFESLRFAGGGAQSDTWAAIMADVLGRPIEQITDPRRANCRGAGFLGLLSLGALTLGDLDALVPVRRRYEPRPEATALFDERTLLYRELHTSLAQPMKRLRRGQ